MTVLYIHGIGKQSEPEALKREWDLSLFDAPAADLSQLVYWSNLRPHKLIDDTYSQAFSMQLFREVKSKYLYLDKTTENLARVLVADIYDYFYNDTLRMQIQALMSAALAQRPEIIIAHSLGTVIAYEALIRENIKIPLLVTLGSPLGLHALQQQLRRVMHVEKLLPPQYDYWLNVADPFDPVAADKTLSDDFGTDVADVRQRIASANPHDSQAYLRTRVVKESVMIHITRSQHA